MNTARKGAAMETKTQATPGPRRAHTFKRGTLDSDFDKLPEQWAVSTDFHAAGKIRNGPEATIAEVKAGETASGIAPSFYHRISDAEAEANARLIAAAPDLFAEALEFVTLMFGETANRGQKLQACAERTAALVNRLTKRTAS